VSKNNLAATPPPILSLWEGGTRGTGLVYAPFLTKSGFEWNGRLWSSTGPCVDLFAPSAGLMHAVDWLPTLVEGLVRQGAPLPPNSTLPLDGVNVWTALTTNATSPRTELYYGLADPQVGVHGPAFRLAEGWKLIVNGSGGTGVNGGKYKGCSFKPSPHPRQLAAYSSSATPTRAQRHLSL
jgi:hypothetical protein